MALNVKSDEAHQLAKKLAEARGTSLTEAVTAALSASLDARTPPRDEELLLSEVAEIQGFVAQLPDRDTRTPDQILGYDEYGVPE